MDGVTSCGIDCVSALDSPALDSPALDLPALVIVLSRHLFCLLTVGRPSLVCVPPPPIGPLSALRHICFYVPCKWFTAFLFLFVSAFACARYSNSLII